jgi:hypothetical protein
VLQQSCYHSASERCARPAGARGGGGGRGNAVQPTEPTVYRASFEQAETFRTTLVLSLRSLGWEQTVYFKGQLIAPDMAHDNSDYEFNLLRPAVP